VLVLRKAATVISAAALRVFGASFAELPYVATLEGYRRAGHCRQLMDVRAPASIYPSVLSAKHEHLWIIELRVLLTKSSRTAGGRSMSNPSAGACLCWLLCK
jgi:hypothetical protein